MPDPPEEHDQGDAVQPVQREAEGDRRKNQRRDQKPRAETGKERPVPVGPHHPRQVMPQGAESGDEESHRIGGLPAPEEQREGQDQDRGGDQQREILRRPEHPEPAACVRCRIARQRCCPVGVGIYQVRASVERPEGVGATPYRPPLGGAIRARSRLSTSDAQARERRPLRAPRSERRVPRGSPDDAEHRGPGREAGTPTSVGPAARPPAAGRADRRSAFASRARRRAGSWVGVALPTRHLVWAAVSRARKNLMAANSVRCPRFRGNV